MERIKIALISIIVLLLSCYMVGAFTVSPGRTEIAMPAGGSYLGSFTIGNPSASPIKVAISAEDWSAQDGRVVEKGDRPSLSWLVFMPQTVELGPYESKGIQYSVNIPIEAKGEYIAMIYFGVAPEQSGGGISVRSRIGNALYVVVAGTEIIEGRISDIKISRANPLRIDVSVENMGNIHVRPKGRLKILCFISSSSFGIDS